MIFHIKKHPRAKSEGVFLRIFAPRRAGKEVKYITYFFFAVFFATFFLATFLVAVFFGADLAFATFFLAGFFVFEADLTAAAFVVFLAFFFTIGFPPL
ncbi:MAG: hypothetical protein U1E36_04885 [Rickettsiales bacterium]